MHDGPGFLEGMVISCLGRSFRVKGGGANIDILSCLARPRLFQAPARAEATQN